MRFLTICIGILLLSSALAWGPPKGPKGPKGRPPPPLPPLPPQPPIGPPSGPPTTGGTCEEGEADASQCSYNPPDTSGLGPFGPTVAASDPSGSASANSNCGDNARPYFEEYEANGYRYILTSAVPNHAAECGQAHVNPNVRCEIWQYAKLPLTWSNSGSIYTTLGTTGYVMSGGVTFDHRSSPFGDLASCNEWASLDPSHGHSAPGGQYHYHAVPTDYSSAADASACEHIGYMRDGGKLYGLCEGYNSCYKLADGVDVATNESDYEYDASGDCQLDDCNMAEINGEMAYFISAQYPFVPPCLKGQVASIQGFTV